MKLKEIDYKLLNYLYHNYNEPISKIAKNTKISRDKVEYRLNKYLQTDLIKQFVPIINYSELGFHKQAVIFLKFETPKMADEFSKQLSKNKNCISHGKILEKFDIYINAIFKNNDELEQFISQLFEEENKLTDYLLISPSFAELYPLKFISNPEKENYELLKNTNKKITLDELDYKILKEISKNGRIKLLDLSLKLKINTTTIFYRLKKLKENKIILGNRIQFNNEKLEYNYSALLINLKKFSEKNKSKIKQFARSSKNTTSLIINIQKPNVIIQFFYKEENEIRQEITKIRKLFENEQIELEIIHLGEEERINTTPFL
ncbi:MAG: Lrp/AsnC family transcriptional regulator [Nanoarchaeota archaeon]|jgi:DNA-binding Lrp family transcriptional regulator|nr:Lrp/AsnC family transcriptional regulator [Nanoarchaeota archaeon]